ncbi:chronologically inappropriate morphogenesis isoform X2 [Arctopsyche grandis]
MDSQQQFCLKWNSFGSNLATAFSNLFKSESLADVTLYCEGTTFRAHKLILAACSKHFQELFAAAPPSHAGPCYVILEATSAANMAALLEFMYKGEVHVSQDALSGFLKSAESLQVKGLSIEHEKLAVAQSQQPAGKVKLNNLAGGGGGGGANAAAGEADSSPGAAFGGALPPYLHALPAYHRPYAPPLPPPIHHHHQHVNQFVEGPRRRALRSPQEPAAPELRSSVLRDGKAPLSPTPSPHARNYRPGSSSSIAGSCDEPDTRSSPGCGGGSSRFEESGTGPATPHTPHSHQPPSSASTNNGYERGATDEMCERRQSADQGAEDLRVKMETPDFPSSGGVGGGGGGGGVGGPYSAPPTPPAPPPDAPPDIPLWPTKHLAASKSGGIATADGKKLKCPFCERLYGYETNLRAHIRQRHQGIRVPCPFCARTFTRNNTVRRHIAREHKHEAALKQFQQHHGPLPNHAQ